MISMVDIASQKDKRGIYINNVGITDLVMPIKVRDKTNEWQHTTGMFNVFVELPPDRKGTHMSRLVEIVYKYRKNINHDGLNEMCKELCEKLNSLHAVVEVDFPYFTETFSPETHSSNLMTHDARFKGIMEDGKFEFRLGVDVDVITVCPCALEECGNGNSHVQRGVVSVDVITDGWVWLEQLIEVAQASGSGMVFDRLKRPDEKAVVLNAFKHPQFVEDVVRTAAVCIQTNQDIAGFRIIAENQESIHTHQAYAEVQSNWNE